MSNLTIRGKGGGVTIVSPFSGNDGIKKTVSTGKKIDKKPPGGTCFFGGVTLAYEVRGFFCPSPGWDALVSSPSEVGAIIVTSSQVAFYLHFLE